MRDLISIVIETFYKKVIDDVLIGYHFARFRDPEVLSHHLERLAGFWEMQLTGTLSVPIEGKPFHLLWTHLQLSLKRGELGRWIVLFHETLDQFENELDKEELVQLKAISVEWKKRITFFEERFKSHPQMFHS